MTDCLGVCAIRGHGAARIGEVVVMVGPPLAGPLADRVLETIEKKGDKLMMMVLPGHKHA